MRPENIDTYKYFRENVDQNHLKCFDHLKREMNKTNLVVKKVGNN